MYYTTWGSVCDGCGHAHRTLAAAEVCLAACSRGCRAQGGYSDREVRVIESPAEARSYDVTRGPGRAVDEYDEYEWTMPRLYGLTEIARLLGVSRQVVHNWLTRRRMPPPTEHLSSGPVWLAEDIEPWIEHRRGK